nr:phage tail spike protein [Amphibacillus jilinensis]
MSQIHITDGSHVLDVITSKNILDNNHHKSLEDTLETFQFMTFSGMEFGQFLEDRNHLIIPGEDGRYVEFTINQVEQFTDLDGKKVEVLSTASYLSLKTAKVISPQILSGATASTAGQFALANTGWELGVIEFTGSRTIEIENHTNPYSFLKRIATLFNLELSFRIEVSANRVTGRYVDLVEPDGVWEGREITLGKDLINIRRIFNIDDVVTALVGLGPIQEDGTRLEVLVEDEEARQRWSKDGRHIIKTYEPQFTDEDPSLERLTELTQVQLDKQINALISYETTIADLEHVPGMENKQLRFGQVIKLKETSFSPPLYLEARIHTMDRSITDVSQKTVTLGDYVEYTEEEVNAVWQQMQQQIASKVSLAQVQEYTYNKDEIEQRDLTVYSNSKDYADTAVENVEIDDNNFRDDQPSTPQNVVAEGFFKVISAKWDYNSSSTIASYEVYASQTPGFTPAVSNLVWSGKAGSIMFEAETNEIWFFRVRAVNTRGTASGYSSEVSAQTVRVQDIDVEMSAINAEKLADLAVTAEKLANGSVITEKLANNAVDEEKLANDSISAIKIQNGAIENDKLDELAVTAEKLADGSVETNKIENYAITEAKIAELAVGSAAIQDLAVTNAKIDNIHAEKITAGVIASERIQIGSGVQFDDGYNPTKIEIGGRNLLKETSNAFEVAEHSTFYATVERITIDSVGLKHGDEITFSAFLKSHEDFGGAVRFRFEREDNTNHLNVYGNDIDNGEEGLSTVTSVIPEGTYYIRLCIQNRPTGVTYESEYKEAKLERGNKRTDWTPAPEDQQDYADNAPLKLWGYEDTTYIDGGNIYANTVTSNEIATGTITAESGIIANAAIGNAAIQNGAISNAKIENGAITNAKIEDATITSAKIHSVTADKLDVAELSAVTGNLGSITAGDITGVSITAIDGDFFLKESESDEKYSVVSKENLIRDHSFELCSFDLSTANITYNWADLSTDLSQSTYWYPHQGNPKIGGVEPGYDKDWISPFGRKNACVRSGDSLHTYVARLNRGESYTLSGHFRRQINTTTGGVPRVEIYRTDDSSGIGTLLASHNFPTVKSDYTLERHSFTFTVPNDMLDIEFLLVVLTSTSNRWVSVDGLQLVEGNYPVIYNQESGLWASLTGEVIASSLRTEDLRTTEITIVGSGGINLISTSGTSNGINLPKNHTIGLHSNDHFTFYHNRSAGEFKVRSHQNGSNFDDTFTIFQSGNARFHNILNVSGNFTVDGTKSATVQTDNYGKRLMYAYEGTQNWFFDMIVKELESGQHFITINEMFLETITGEFYVRIYEQTPCTVKITQKTDKGFYVDVQTDDVAQVVFEVFGLRRNHESEYMGLVTEDNEEAE